MNIIGLSKWIHESARKSSLLQNKDHYQLPNLIDSNRFIPIDKKQARFLLNLPDDKKLVLFGAMGATSDPRKGFDYLQESVDRIKGDVELVVFGSSEPKENQNLAKPVHYLGHLYDDISLKLLYSAADVMVVPSLQENLSNAIMESLSCATPVVAFDIGGNGDMVIHKHNGYLSKPLDALDLACGIEWVLDNPNYTLLCDNARNKVMRDFDSDKVVQRYIELYEEVLAK